MKKKILPALFLLCVCAVLLAACSEDLPTLPAEDGYAVSGSITADGEPLEGVSVLADGQEAGKTNSYGIYSLTGLEYGTVIAFVADGYTFSPESYTVRENAYDLNVLAFKETPDDGDTDEPSEPDEPTEPDEPSEPDEPTEPEEPEKLDVPHGFFAAYTDDGNIVLNFSADGAAQSFSFALSCGDTSLSAECAVTEDKESKADFGEFSLPVYVGSESEDGLSVLMDVTDAVSFFGGTFTVTVTASAENMKDGVSEPFVCSFAAGEPRVYGLTLQDGTLSWHTEHLPEGCTFAVIVNGLRVYETAAEETDLADLPFALPDGATLRVAAEKDGSAVAVSEEIVFGETM